MTLKDRHIRKVIFLTQMLLLGFVNNPVISQHHIFEQETFSKRNPLLRVNEILQDPNGLIWLGSSDGLMSYDGINYQLLPETESKSISHISKLSQDELFAGTEDGTLFRVNINSGDAEVIFVDIIQSRITAVVTKDDRLYVATYGDGLWVFYNSIWYKADKISENPINDIYDMSINSAGQIFLGTDEGLLIIEDDRHLGRILTVNDGLPDNIVTVVQADKYGSVWLGFHQNGFCTINDDNISNTSFTSNWDYGPVEVIFIDRSSSFIGTKDGKVLKFDQNTQKIDELFQKANQKSAINDIIVDQEANLWISDNKNGILKTSLLYAPLDLPNTVDPKNIQAIFIDNKNHVWFSTAKALYECSFDKNNRASFKKHLNSDIYGTSFISLYVDTEIVWVGTFGGGLLCYCPETGKVIKYKEKDGLANNNILSIAGTKEKIWFATLGGVSEANKNHFNTKNNEVVNFKNYHEEDGLGTEYIYQIYMDSGGRLWFATDGHGLTMMEGGKFTNYSEKDGLGSKVIYSITEDSEKNIWLATPKNGIYKFDGQSFENFPFENYQISALTAIDTGIVIVHKYGIDIFKDNQLRSIAPFEKIGEINPDLNAVTKDEEGNVWIGHHSGLLKLTPNLQANMHPDILITKTLINLEQINPQDTYQFNYDENYITFNYLGIWYSDPLNIHYQYRLNGITNEWINTRDNFVTFSNLPSGAYTFSVRAGTNEHFMNASVASYSFTINAPFWESLWFYLVILLMMSGIVWAIIYARDTTLKKRSLIEREKIQFQFETLKSQINPHFLFNSFNTLISIIEEEPKLAAEYVEKLSDFFRNILQLREKDVIPLREEIVLLMDYSFLQEKRFGQNFNLIVHIPDQWLETQIPPLTIQLLAENAIKHNVISKNRPLTFRMFIEDDYIIVQNNINLKRKPEVSTNYGLENIIKRYQLITKIPVTILNDESYFTIKLPIITT